MAMRSGTKSNKTGYRGVYIDQRHKERPFRAKIFANGKSYRLGGFKTAEEAGRAYDRMAFKLWGSEAILNFPHPVWKNPLIDFNTPKSAWEQLQQINADR